MVSAEELIRDFRDKKGDTFVEMYGFYKPKSLQQTP